MGRVLTKAEDAEATIFAEIDLDLIDQTRQRIPLNRQRRFDLYGRVENVQ
jgi:predicted amidohydrolase